MPCYSTTYSKDCLAVAPHTPGGADWKPRAQAYSVTRLDFLANLDGVYVGDRAQGTATEGKRWVPAADNTRWLPFAEELPANSSDIWGLYTGNWGAFDVNDGGNSAISIVCLYDNQTTTGAPWYVFKHTLVSNILWYENTVYPR